MTQHTPGLIMSLVTLIFAGVAIAPAFASDHFNLESGIPITIEDIEPIERGSLELQGFARFLRLRGEKNVGEAEPRLAVGILEKTQLEIAAPLNLGEGSANGNGDAQISILRKLHDAEQDWWPGLGVEADMRLPTGVENPGFRNRVDAGFTALMKKRVGAHAFHLNAGFDWSDDESRDEDLRPVVWSVAAGHHLPLGKRFVLVSDLVWRQADEIHTSDIWLLESGVRAQLTPKLIGAFGVGAGLNRGAETPAFTLTLGFQIGL